MTIYWRISQFVLGIFIIIQAAILIAQQLSIDPEAIQETGGTLLNNHLHQRLPEYYYKVSQDTEVWSSPSSLENEISILLDTLFSSSVVTVLGNVSMPDSSQAKWLKIAYQGKDQTDQTGWITHP